MHRLVLLFVGIFSPLIAAANDQLCFPDGFLFGTATAAYQIEGGWNEGGRTPSVWDDFCRQQPKLACANVADDFYHRYEDDIQLMKEAGHNLFRFSVSWSRVMNWDPSTRHMKPNPAGIKFYHSVIDALNKNGITPILTMYHFDLPREMQEELSPPGWLTPKVQDHFVEFAELLYHEYGNKVKYWTTFNEPYSFAVVGYSDNSFGVGFPGSTGPSDTNQYIAAHNVLISHAKAVKRFRELKEKHVVNGDAAIGIVLVSEHNVPFDASSLDDIEAVERSSQFMMGWFLEPMISGDYPKVMRERIKERLPRFTPEESAMLIGSYDVFNINHYTTHQATDCASPRSKVPCDKLPLGWYRDMGVDNTGKPPGARPSAVDREDGHELCSYFSAVPTGYRDTLRWVSAYNKSTPILLTENGFCGNDEIEDQPRLWYHQTYLEQVQRAIVEDKIPVIGYTAWSLMDNYEWGSYRPRFGLYYVNYTSQAGTKDSWTPKSTDLARIPRLAARWYSGLAKSGCMEPYHEDEQVAQATGRSIIRATHSSRVLWISATVGIIVVAAVGIAIAIVRHYRAGNAQEQAPLLRA